MILLSNNNYIRFLSHEQRILLLSYAKEKQVPLNNGWTGQFLVHDKTLFSEHEFCGWDGDSLCSWASSSWDYMSKRIQLTPEEFIKCCDNHQLGLALKML